MIYLKEYDEDQIAIANRTARSSGNSVFDKDGNIKSVVARYILKTADAEDSILDFGSGPQAVQTKALMDSGLKDITAYDFGGNIKDGVHNPNALSNEYDIVFASNVLNVSSTEEMLRSTLQDIWGSVASGGRAIFNYPVSPRKAGLSPKEVSKIITDEFGKAPVLVGGSSSNPLWEILK